MPAVQSQYAPLEMQPCKHAAPVSDIICVVCRPEMKFDGIGALIARIKTDAGIAAKQLEETTHQQVMQDPFLSG